MDHCGCVVLSRGARQRTASRLHLGTLMVACLIGIYQNCNARAWQTWTGYDTNNLKCLLHMSWNPSSQSRVVHILIPRPEDCGYASQVIRCLYQPRNSENLLQKSYCDNFKEPVSQKICSWQRCCWAKKSRWAQRIKIVIQARIELGHSAWQSGDLPQCHASAWNCFGKAQEQNRSYITIMSGVISIVLTVLVICFYNNVINLWTMWS